MSDGMVQRRRDEVIDLLTDAFARDLLDTAEYEYRVGQANAVDDLARLNSLVADLTKTRERSLQKYPSPGSMDLSAVFSTQHFDGDWLTNEHVKLRTFMGSVVCDFRRPVLGPLTRVEIRAIMGEVKIIVPKGVRIQVNINPILGEVTRHRGDNRFLRQVKGLINSFIGSEESRELINPESHPAASIEIFGSAFMSSVRIIEKDGGIFD
jgi:hypothetical protein